MLVWLCKLAPPVESTIPLLQPSQKQHYPSPYTNTLVLGDFSSHRNINQVFLLSQLVSTTSVQCPEFALSYLISREEQTPPPQIQEQFLLFLSPPYCYTLTPIAYERSVVCSTPIATTFKRQQTTFELHPGSAKELSSPFNLQNFPDNLQFPRQLSVYHNPAQFSPENRRKLSLKTVTVSKLQLIDKLKVWCYTK